MSTMRVVVMLVLFGAGAGLFWSRCRSGDPARHVQDQSYPVRCMRCPQKGALTIAAMNAMVKRHEAESPAGQMRRFKCPSCGEIAVVLDAGGASHVSVASKK